MTSANGEIGTPEPEHHTALMKAIRKAVREGRTEHPAPCEWPARVGSSFKCGKSSKDYATAESGKWGRPVCGIHAPVAKRRGWVLANDARVSDDGTYARHSDRPSDG